MESDTVDKALKTNEPILKSKIGESFDTKYRHFRISLLNDSKAFIVYISGMTTPRIIDETILKPLMKRPNLFGKQLHFNSQNYTSILLPLTLVLVFPTYYMAADHNKYVDFLAFPHFQICLILSVGLPILMFLATLFRGKLTSVR